ncbi:hypothetical protein G6F68_016334 [Rhizopus microsporus]|nr:hypothetical protein G6F68_016334 [Rhizopus microsporus]
MADRVNSLFSEGATNIAGVWSNFFDSVSGLSSNASGTADRQNMLDGGKALANRFVQLNTHLNNLNGEVNNGLLAAAAPADRLHRRHGGDPGRRHHECLHRRRQRTGGGHHGDQGHHRGRPLPARAPAAGAGDPGQHDPA